MNCPDDNTLAALFDRSIGSATLDALDGHLDECERCRTVVALALGSKNTAHGSPPALTEIERDPEGLIGQTIDDRYRVASLLGRGGMGTVYLARDVTLDRDIALKIHRAGTDDVRLKREAVAMAQLAHPNVVNVFEVGMIAAATYVAMEYVRGATLRAWLAAAPRPWRRIVEVLVDAGRGLAAAHDAGLVHRDFKPANVLVGDDDRPRVSDFGLARVAERTAVPAGDTPAAASVETTLAGTVMGTPAYMAPEQFERTDIDARGDQFSFCVVAWECLYGRRPFGGSTITEVRTAIERHELERVARSKVPDRVRRVLERGLAVAPADRYPEMPALLVDLRRAATPRLARRATIAIVLAAAALGTVGARPRRGRSVRGVVARRELGSAATRGNRGGVPRDGDAVRAGRVGANPNARSTSSPIGGARRPARRVWRSTSITPRTPACTRVAPAVSSRASSGSMLSSIASASPRSWAARPPTTRSRHG